MVLAEDLRQAVLQAALQGRLTEQLETDSNVDEMLKNIQKEKEKLIADKKIKKEKPLPEIQEEEIPFDIPESWRWVKVGNICDCGAGATPPRGNKDFYDNGTIPWLKTGELTNGYIYRCEEKITYLALEKCSLRLNQKDDILIAMYGATIGKLGIVTFPLTTNQACCGCTPYMGIYNLYLFYCFMCIKETLIGKAEGGAQPNISREKIRSSLVPVPPIEEQQRIVDKINEIMPKIDEYEKIEKELKALKKAFPENVKSAILQAAMQGNLTEQLENDSKVDELLLNIEKDREDKINSGLVKNDKRLFTKRVDDEDTSLTIPDSWRSVTLGSILYKLTDGTHKTPKYVTNGVKFVSVKDMSSGKLDLSSTKFITKEEHEELFNRCNPEKGDMLLSKVGTTGVPAIVDTDEKFSLFVSVALLKYNHQFINEKFLYYLICSPLVQEQVKENTRGVGNKNWVLDFIAKTVIVLPPIEEQKRIVERLETLLPLCEELKDE